MYAASKLASEHLSYAHYKEDGLPLAIVRPFNVYGPRQVGDGAIRGIILQALKHAPITLYNDGTQIRAWCFVDDFVDGVLRCAEKPAAIGHAFNLGNPQGTATNFELANMIIRLTNSKSDDRLQAASGAGSRTARAVDRKGGGAPGLPADVSLEAGISRTIRVVRRAPGRRAAQALMRLVVTGASGFIGRNVLLRAPRDWEIVAVYNRTAGLEAFVGSQRAEPRDAGPMRPDQRGRRSSAFPDDRRSGRRGALSGGKWRPRGVGQATALGS